MKKEFTPREFGRLLETNGFIFVRCRGDHKTYKREGCIVTIPVVNKTINRMMTQRLIRENNLI